MKFLRSHIFGTLNTINLLQAAIEIPLVYKSVIQRTQEMFNVKETGKSV